MSLHLSIYPSIYLLTDASSSFPSGPVRFGTISVGHQVMIAACDTFRSGAVEQLKVHARCLEVDLFDKGYHKDPAAVAKEAIKDATAVSRAREGGRGEEMYADGCLRYVCMYMSTICMYVYICRVDMTWSW